MKPVLINEEAADELDEAIRYYETKSRAIGFSLADKVSEAFNRIQRNPHLYPFHKDTNVQRCIIRRFLTPCSTSSLVIAVAHQRRRPDYWKFRLTSVNETSDSLDRAKAYGDRKP